MSRATAGSFRTPPGSSIIYQNTGHDTVLLDIPKSIAVAQGRSDTLLSTTPLDAPIVLNQNKAHGPSTHKDQTAQHTEYKTQIDHALGEIRTHVSGSWCAPRKLMTQEPRHGAGETMQCRDPEMELESRLREWAAWNESKGDDVAGDLERLMASLGATCKDDSTAADTVAQKWWYYSARDSTNDTTTDAMPMATRLCDITAGPRPSHMAMEPWTSILHNPRHDASRLTLCEKASPLVPDYHFTVPSRSTLFLSDCSHADAFRTSFRKLTDEYALPRHFDLVILDPPWPNRSAKRKGTYEQVGGMPFMKKMLLKMDIDSYLEQNALVAIWVTNKESLREHVLGPGGLFEAWNVGLVEEWIWIKTTSNGEPMFGMDDLRRKPYEILLLGRAAPNAWTTMTHARLPRRRVIAAVPDVHSRKPCLKELLETYRLVPNDYTALEAFSRYLVSGWMSWGNEVLKYSWDEYWVPNASIDDPS